ncbi:MAG: DNA-binding response regulator [Chloroflexi bacterium]|nr:MAG: DNA-binding response regulator [Chloroflexota bacterium]MBL1197274.1 DNA-binding response regulator [Chloroflexota bacterium]NOH14569.1 response regulator transcription factor [Chloroflexota bacterium]
MVTKTSMDKTAKILWVEGRWKSNPDFIPNLRKKGFAVEIVSSGKEALAQVGNKEPDVIVVDAASFHSSGKRICRTLREQVNGMPIMLISDPERPVANDDDCANVILELPFTSRKLVNRINPLLPIESKKITKAGPIRLDTKRKQVTCFGKKTTLTPRLIRLLRMLIKHKGEVVEREELFKKVWATNYTGDTRTLDVHISWLRQAIEKDPRKPELLKTIRGVGYRLDV